MTRWSRAMARWTVGTGTGTLALAVALAPSHASAQAAPPPARVSFTKAQAEAGSRVYAKSCASCHGSALDDGVAAPLAGSTFLQKWARPDRTLEELHFVTRNTMPKNAGNTLPAADYTAVLAYLLERNGYAPGDSALVAERSVLANVRLPMPAGSTAARKSAPEFVRGDFGLVPTTMSPTLVELRAAPQNGRDWLTHTRDYAGSRYSPLKQITSANASQLRPSCMYQVGEVGNFQTGPVVYDGTLYLTTVLTTIAIDAATCREKWKHTWKPLAAEIRVNNRGVTIGGGRVLRGTADGYLIALDRETGKLLYARHVGDAGKGETFTMSPLAYDSLVFMGPAVGELGIRGWIAAYRVDNGERAWRFNVIPAPGEPGAETWKQDSKLPLGGGAIWTPLSIDVEKDLLFVSVANPAPDFPEAMRGGTNLYTNSVVALNLHTGKLAWYEQMVPNDDHDWDLTQVSPLYRAKVNGSMRNLMATAGKDGMLRVVDRDSKQRLFETPVTTILNADAPVTTKGTHACPGVLGGVQWNGPAYHPGTNLLVVPAVELCATFFLDDTVRFIPGQLYMGGRVVNDTSWRGWLTAVDASTGKVRWKYESKAPMIAAVTTTAGNVAFAGEIGGDFLALDAASGAVRYRFNTGGPIGGGIVTYEAGGTQYVAVASGRPSGYWTREHPGSPTIVVLSLPKGVGGRP